MVPQKRNLMHSSNAKNSFLFVNSNLHFCCVDRNFQDQTD
jgi:hypothetical protein